MTSFQAPVLFLLDAQEALARCGRPAEITNAMEIVKIMEIELIRHVFYCPTNLTYAMLHTIDHGLPVFGTARYKVHTFCRATPESLSSIGLTGHGRSL